jgi:hypothetical protein
MQIKYINTAFFADPDPHEIGAWIRVCYPIALSNPDPEEIKIYK